MSPRFSFCVVVAVLVVGFCGLIGGSNVSIPNVFVNGQAADANQVNANFTALRTGSNDNFSRIQGLDAQVQSLDSQTQSLESRLASLEALLEDFSIAFVPDGQGGTVKTIVITGANLQIVNGLGATNGNPADPDDIVNYQTNGVGNLILGYQEVRIAGVNDRTGSHNLVIGPGNNFTSFAGFIAGSQHDVTAPCASIVGGEGNTATAFSSCIVGGSGNLAAGRASCVIGGCFNTTSNTCATVSGGNSNTASGENATVSGGAIRSAAGINDWVAGGLFQDS